jgi:hypothetical protein
MKRLIIISSSHGATEDERLSELATFLGVSTETLRFEGNGDSASALLNQVRRGPCTLAMHIETLGLVYSALGPDITLQQLLDDRFQEILVYGVRDATETNEALRALTDGVIRGVIQQPINAVRYSFPREAREFSAQLAGQNWFINREHGVPTINVRPECGPVDTIMAANERPVFVRLRTGFCELFLFAGCVPDLSAPVGRGAGPGDACIPLIPTLIFLRHCFSESCWHGDGATARLIIDDPLLKKIYGALNLETLKGSIEKLEYGASIAFIPWNYWRSSRRSAGRLVASESNLSICVHGCDHTNHEFRSGSSDVLMQKAALGIWRMEEHRKRVGVPFEDVMVFPQGQFSKAAIQALRSANFLATVNSTCFPTDSRPDDLTVADFIWPAVTRFSGFPLFQRRYPESAFEFALDLFLGKPAFIVEHHEYFRDGCREIEKFVSALQQIEPRLSWPGLSEQLMRCRMKRRRDDGSFETRFFTRRFQFMPGAAEQGLHWLSKCEPNPNRVESVLVDGRKVSFGFEQANLVFQVQAVPGQNRTVEIIDRPAPTAPIHNFGVIHNARVLMRRGLSEFRDDTLSRHQGLLKVAERMAKALKATSES